ncbi:MAG TPA: ribosome maturation factor RimM [Candidatus Dormibacteraeota bacterium]|nr:ribosome maturation factor RimM [Candidatus Dormibacteraeota bacterium]
MTDGGQPELRIGRVLRAHGLNGAVRVELLTDFPDRFRRGSEIQVAGRHLVVASSQPQDGSVLLTFEGVHDRNAAEALVGAYCTLPLSAARELPADHFYSFQLVGLRVVDARRQRQLGTVAEVLSYAANDVLRVVDGRREILVPMVKSVVQTIDPAGGTITIDLPEETTA